MACGRGPGSTGFACFWSRSLSKRSSRPLVFRLLGPQLAQYHPFFRMSDTAAVVFLGAVQNPGPSGLEEVFAVHGAALERVQSEEQCVRCGVSLGHREPFDPNTWITHLAPADDRGFVSDREVAVNTGHEHNLGGVSASEGKWLGGFVHQGRTRRTYAQNFRWAECGVLTQRPSLSIIVVIRWTNGSRRAGSVPARVAPRCNYGIGGVFYALRPARRSRDDSRSKEV